MLRVFRDGDGEWWADRSDIGRLNHWGHGVEHVRHLDEFEDEVSSRLALLLHVDPGRHIEGVGRRISKDTFWLFHEGEDSWLLTADTAQKI